MNILRLFQNFGQDILIFLILGALILLFLKDFKLTSRRSWMVLLGLASLGGIFAIRFFKQRNLLKELEKREQALKELERQYADLKEQGRISEEKYHAAKTELDRAKREAAKSVLGAEESYRKKLEAIEKEHEQITPEELILRSLEIIKNK